MKTFLSKGIFATLFFTIAFSSCIRQKNTWILQDVDSENATNNFTNPKKTSYRIQPGDNLYINIYSNDKGTSAYFQTNFPTVMSQTYLYLNSHVVNEEGYLTFTFIDKMYVQGLTIEEIQKQLQATMSTYFKDVTITVKMVSFEVSVIGEVASAGKFLIPEDNTNVLEVVALAGGFKEYADRQRITLVRQTSTGSDVHYLNLMDKNMLASEYFYLMPNDVIYVQSLKSKSWTYEKFPYGLFMSTLALLVSIVAITTN